MMQELVRTFVSETSAIFCAHCKVISPAVELLIAKNFCIDNIFIPSVVFEGVVPV